MIAFFFALGNSQSLALTASIYKVLWTSPPWPGLSILVFIGACMLSQAKFVDWEEPLESVPAFITLTSIPFCFSVPQGIAIGAFASTVLLSSDRALTALERCFVDA